MNAAIEPTPPGWRATSEVIRLAGRVIVFVERGEFDRARELTAALSREITRIEAGLTEPSCSGRA
jgi:predicted translin family RNA/ssDNA-binding protein